MTTNEPIQSPSTPLLFFPTDTPAPYALFCLCVFDGLQVIQLQSTERMQVLAPTVKEINAKFGQNKEAATAATNRLYKETNVNPLIGCLPALLQVCCLAAIGVDDVCRRKKRGVK